MRNKIIRIVLILLIVILGTAFVYSIKFIVKVNQFRQVFTFTQEKWTKEPLKRNLIVDDMLKKYDISTMTKEKVTKLLGEPTHDWSFTHKLTRLDNSEKPVCLNYKNSACYIIKQGDRGKCYGFYLLYDDNGKVMDHAIISIVINLM